MKYRNRPRDMVRAAAAEWRLMDEEAKEEYKNHPDVAYRLANRRANQIY